MTNFPQTPVFILEGQDISIHDSVRHAQGHVEPIDVKAGIYAGYDAWGRRLSISTDGKDTIIELAGEELPNPSPLEAELRAFLISLGEERASGASCDLPCLIELAGRHAELDRGALLEAAREFEDRHRDAIEERGGDLQVSVVTASHLRQRTKVIELYAEVEWENARLYDHAHVLVARRQWFSWRWERVRSLRQAIRELDEKVGGWLRAGA